MKNKKAISPATNKVFSNNTILLILSILGMALSAYLWYYQTNPDLSIPCTNDGCGHILSSPYSFIFKIPMSVYGFFFYAYLATILLQRYFIKDKFLELLLKLSLLVGLIFSIYLRILEFFVIHSICAWCWISFMIVLALIATYFLRPNKSAK